MHVSLLIREGRWSKVQTDIAQQVMAALKETFDDRFESGHLSISVDIKGLC